MRFLQVRGSTVRFVYWTFIASIAFGATAQAGQRWVLIHYRQMGNQINGGRHTLENHLFLENGSRAAGIGVTNAANPLTAVFGLTQSDGHNRINPLDENNCAYDIQILQSGIATDQTPNFYFQNPPLEKWYSFITMWMRVTDDTQVVAFPTTPVYQYDLVDGINGVVGMNNSNCTASQFNEAPGANSDAFSVGVSGQTLAQTFVVPPGINRIVAAQAHLIRGEGTGPFFYNASIHQGSPSGSQVGPLAASVQHHSANFKEDAVYWGINAVPVTPGQTYAIKFTPTDGQSVNAYATDNNNYAQGTYYSGNSPIAGRDMIATVVGISVGVQQAVIDVTPSSFNRDAPRRQILSSDTFNVRNTGNGRMTYAFNEQVQWLSVSPSSGEVETEADPISIIYDTSSLPLGQHVGEITISSANATNSPQKITVTVNVTPPTLALADFDQDGDVDQADFGRFQACYNSHGTPQQNTAWAGARLDADDDVDSSDFGLFLGCMSGPGAPADPLCSEQ